ncbi:MAG: hypothetical protein NZ956_02130 [Candidatus Caldarchaeum sp.]|nr:hypothetical protein [Candidatus Caldarchaeum sp.]
MKNPLRTEFDSQENVDLLMLFITVLGMSKLSVRQILKTLSKSEMLPRSFAEIFAKATALVDRWNYGVSEVLEFIQTEMKKPKLRGLVTRIQHSFKAGVSLEDFARIEYSKHKSEQENEFEKGLEKLRRLVEAYTTLISVVSLLTVSFLLVSTILGGTSGSFLEIALISVATTLGSTTLLFLTNNLRRPLFSRNPIKPKTLQTLLRVSPAAFAASIALAAAAPSVATFTGGMNVAYASTAMALAGVPLCVHGYLGRRWHKKINKTENMLPIFLKSFGDYLSATGSIKSAVHMLTLSDFGPLNQILKKLEARLKLGVSQTLAVKTFGVETYGRIGENALGVLAELLESGARPTHACNTLSDYVSANIMNDKRREQITSSLKTLSIPLHATLAAIFALLTTLLTILSKISELLENYLMLIKPVDTATVVTYFYTIIIVTSLITAVNIYLADGDSPFTLSYFMGIILSVSGVCYMVMTAASEQLLSSFIGLSENIRGITPG